MRRVDFNPPYRYLQVGKRPPEVRDPVNPQSRQRGCRLPASFLRRAWLLAWSFGVIFQCYRRPKECPPAFAPTGWMALTYPADVFLSHTGWKEKMVRATHHN